jgi:hypothetical protein
MEKKVDEEWKRQVQREKDESARKERKAQYTRRPKEDFTGFVAGLAAQAMTYLGLLENPTGRTEPDLAQAEYVINTLQMLQEKTKGNLTPQEQAYLEQILHELRLGFVRVSR